MLQGLILGAGDIALTLAVLAGAGLTTYLLQKAARRWVK